MDDNKEYGTEMNNSTPEVEEPVQTDIENTENAQPHADNESMQAANDPAPAEYTYEWKEASCCGIKHDDKKPSKKKKRRLQVFVAIVTTICILSLMTVSYLLVGMLGDDVSDSTSLQTTSDTNSTDKEVTKYVSISEVFGANSLLLPDIYKKLENSCVSILSNYSSGSGFNKVTGTSLGSGFIITEDGYVITNHHVIENSTGITVIMYDGTEYPAVLIDSRSDCDIAVLKIEGTFTPVEIGSSDALSVGDFVCAIGTPSDLEFAGTMTFGIISAINRNVTITNTNGTVIKTMKLIQTDATLNPGNSGGPLINMYGQVIGINTLKLSDTYEGIGFSIPMSDAIDIINALIDGKSPNTSTVTKSAAYLGITAETITEDEAEHYDVPVGVLVYQIVSDGSAYKAGLRRGDIIVKFNGDDITTKEELSAALAACSAGDSASIMIYRENDYMTFTFTLDARTE